LWIVAVFSHMIFFKIIFVELFVFWILSWLRIIIIIKLNHVAKALYISSQNTMDCYKSFCSVSKFLITNTTFFLSWNIGSIIPLVFITYIALVHNYNIIKYICFISPRRRAGMPSRVEHIKSHNKNKQSLGNVKWVESLTYLLLI
jgi:hypothetical protein